MKIVSSELAYSCAKKEQWPKEVYPEILLCGRSNVGKSSFINTLCERKNLAYTSKTPGMTRLLNFYLVNKTFMLVDAPGYGFQQKNKEQYVEFDTLMNDYFSSRKNLNLCFLLVDSRLEPTQDDLLMLEFLQSNHKNTQVVLTKVDKLSNNELFRQKKVISKKLQINENDLILFSSLNKKGREDVLKKIQTIL